MFFYKERKRRERTERSFEKNGCPTLHRHSLLFRGSLHGALHDLQPMGRNITLNVVQSRMVGLLTAILPTLRLFVVLLQPPDSKTIFISRMGKAPEAPAFALYNVPPSTCRKGQKHVTVSPSMHLIILTAGDKTPKFPG